MRGAVHSGASARLRDRLRAAEWRVIVHPPAAGAWNMAVDCALLGSAAADGPPATLRLYGWSPPVVSLGRFQDAASIDQGYARARGWDVVRRPTGGRGVLHQHELTYSVTLGPAVAGGAGVRTTYHVLVDALHEGLRSLLGRVPVFTPPACTAGATRTPNCFALAGECDSLVPGGKLVGSAQVRRGGAVLQQGSILLDAEPGAWEALFGDAGRMVTLRELLGRAVSFDEAAAAVRCGFGGLARTFVEGELSSEELAATRQAMLASTSD